MRKLFLLLVVTILTSTKLLAQNTLVATLTHGTEITMFYGIYALQAAHEAAVSGDIINLSGGSFESVDIKKSLTLRGAGIDAAMPTYIIGDFNINIPSEDENQFSMEGIRCSRSISITNTFCNPLFTKCQFNESITFKTFDTNVIRNAQFTNCKITRGSNSVSLSGKDKVQFINCYIKHPVNSSNSGTVSPTLINCVVDIAYSLYKAELINCIFSQSARNTIPSTATATNCVSTTTITDIFSDLGTRAINCKRSTFAETFKDYTGTYSDMQTFELTETAKTTMLGNDGTQVGMHGGLLPYNSTPSYPLITKMNVSNKTTADGKLSVEIEVSATE